MINAIFAVDEAGGLGFENGLPWPQNSTDMQHFKGLTVDHTVVMGRNTWDSIPPEYRPLPHRHNIVITSKSHDFSTESGVITMHPLIIDDYLQTQYNSNDIFIIGGKQVILTNLHLIDRIYLTVIQGTYEADVSLDMDVLLRKFNLVDEVHQNNCTFKEYIHETIYQ